MNTADPRRPSLGPVLIPLLHASFVLTGVVNTLLGPLLPLLSSRWHMTDAQAGNLFVAQFLGSMVGVTGSSLLVAKSGPRLCLGGGLFMMAAGVAGLGLVRWSSGLVPLFILGVGLGLEIPTTNILISELYPHKRAAALSIINLSWGIGAVICPFLVVAALGISESFVILYGLAALLLLAIVILTRVPLPICLLTTKVGNSDRHPAAIWLNRYVPILGAVFFLYVGTEASVGGWIASYAQRSMPAGRTWLITPSYFWGSLLFGRLITPILLRQLKEASLSSLGLLLAVFGVTAAITARNSIELDVSTCLAGLGLSAVFPIAIAILSLKFGSAASRVAGLMFNLAGFGGATLPWVVGVVSTRFGNLKFGLFVPLCGCLAMLFLNLLLQQGSPSSDESRA